MVFQQQQQSNRKFWSHHLSKLKRGKVIERHRQQQGEIQQQQASSGDFSGSSSHHDDDEDRQDCHPQEVKQVPDTHATNTSREIQDNEKVQRDGSASGPNSRNSASHPFLEDEQPAGEQKHIVLVPEVSDRSSEAPTIEQQQQQQQQNQPELQPKRIPTNLPKGSKTKLVLLSYSNKSQTTSSVIPEILPHNRNRSKSVTSGAAMSAGNGTKTTPQQQDSNKEADEKADKDEAGTIISSKHTVVSKEEEEEESRKNETAMGVAEDAGSSSSTATTTQSQGRAADKETTAATPNILLLLENGKDDSTFSSVFAGLADAPVHGEATPEKRRNGDVVGAGAPPETMQQQQEQPQNSETDVRGASALDQASADSISFRAAAKEQTQQLDINMNAHSMSNQIANDDQTPNGILDRHQSGDNNSAVPPASCSTVGAADEDASSWSSVATSTTQRTRGTSSATRTLGDDDDDDDDDDDTAFTALLTSFPKRLLSRSRRTNISTKTNATPTPVVQPRRPFYRQDTETTTTTAGGRTNADMGTTTTTTTSSMNTFARITADSPFFCIDKWCLLADGHTDNDHDHLEEEQDQQQQEDGITVRTTWVDMCAGT